MKHNRDVSLKGKGNAVRVGTRTRRVFPLLGMWKTFGAGVTPLNTFFGNFIVNFSFGDVVFMTASGGSRLAMVCHARNLPGHSRHLIDHCHEELDLAYYARFLSPTLPHTILPPRRSIGNRNHDGQSRCRWSERSSTYRPWKYVRRLQVCGGSGAKR